MSHLMTTAAVDSSRLPENRNPEKSKSHIDCRFAKDLPPANARQNESRASATAYSLRTPTPLLASDNPASSRALKSANSRGAVSASDLWYWHRSSQENHPDAARCKLRARRTRAAARLIGSDRSAAWTSASYCDATSSETRKPVAKTTNAKPSIQEPVIFGWALAVLMVALVNMETAVVAASPGSRLASWALWGFGCWAMFFCGCRSWMCVECSRLLEAAWRALGRVEGFAAVRRGGGVAGLVAVRAIGACVVRARRTDRATVSTCESRAG